jgi:hypothetical protein
MIGVEIKLSREGPEITAGLDDSDLSSGELSILRGWLFYLQT